MTEQDLPSLSTKFYTHDAWNRLTSVKVDEAVLGEYEYNALHWRSVKRSRSLGAGGLDEMRLMYYSANWQLLEQRIDRQWPGSGFTEDERAQTFWGKRYIDDAVVRRRDRAVSAVYEDNFFYVSDAQFSTVVMVKASNARVVERVTYDSYGKARHHFGGDVTGDGAATTAGDDALVATIGQTSGKSIGGTYYTAEQDLNRDGQISNADRTTLFALTGGAAQAALASGEVSFTTTGSGGSTIHGPDNPIAWDGCVFNAETSQYLVRFRWYDPVLGRWLERDPMGYWGSMGRYEYAPSNPLRFIDPFGLDDEEVKEKPKRGFWWYVAPWHWFGGDDSDHDEGDEDDSIPVTVEPVTTGDVFDLFEAGDDDLLEDGTCVAHRCKLNQIAEGAHVVVKVVETGQLIAGVVVVVIVPGPEDAVFAALGLLKGVKLISKVVDESGAVRWLVRRADGTDEVLDPAKAKTLEDAMDAADLNMCRIQVALTGQRHHPISKIISDALDRHPTLNVLTKRQRRRSTTQAVDKASHNGWAQWHRELDAEIAKWLDEHPETTIEEFAEYLIHRYQQPDLIERFPNGIDFP